MNKAVIIGIVVLGIILGVLAISSLNSSSIIEENDMEEKNPVLENGGESKPQGRNLSIELDEKMGFTDP